MATAGDFAASRAGRRDNSARDTDLARNTAQHAEERKQQLALSLPVKAAEPDDLARARMEGNDVQPVRPAEVLDFEQRRRSFVAGRRLRRKDVTQLAADHHLNDLVVRLRSGDVARDIGAVAKNRTLVGELGDLVHAVRDVEEREPLVAQALEHHEHFADVRSGQRRRRLVEDENSGCARQRLGDLDHLPPRKGQILDEGHRVNVGRAGARERFLCEAALGAPVDEPEPDRRTADGDVVGDRQVGNERQLLEDADDAGAVRGGGGVEGDVRPVKHDAAGVGPDDARQDLDQRRLAGAVLPQDGVDASRHDGQARILERAHAAIALRHALHPEDRGGGLRSRHGLGPCAAG